MIALERRDLDSLSNDGDSYSPCVQSVYPLVAAGPSVTPMDKVSALGLPSSPTITQVLVLGGSQAP